MRQYSRVVMFSGGLGSAAAALVSQPDALLFTDTLIEDADLYRFLDDAADTIGAPLIRIADGRTPWQVFFDVRMMGSTQRDPCSRVLKRDLAAKWLRDNTPEDAEVVFGITFEEGHRANTPSERMKPRRAVFPLVDACVFKDGARRIVEQAGIRIPRLYDQGFPHNNCGGACVKAGHAQWAHLLRVNPCLYDEWERNEEQFRAIHGDVAILRDRSGGATRPMPLSEFREKIQSGGQIEIDLFDWGGCGCMMDDDHE